jgi:hypothetical protein
MKILAWPVNKTAFARRGSDKKGLVLWRIKPGWYVFTLKGGRDSLSPNSHAIQQHHLFVCLFARDICRFLVPKVKKHTLRLADGLGVCVLRLLEACLLLVDGFFYFGALSGRHRVFALGENKRIR